MGSAAANAAGRRLSGTSREMYEVPVNLLYLGWKRLTLPKSRWPKLHDSEATLSDPSTLLLPCPIPFFSLVRRKGCRFDKQNDVHSRALTYRRVDVIVRDA